MAALVSRVLKEEGLDRIVDLGSGAGGTLPDILALVKEDSDMTEVRVTMTDLYPNLDAVARFNQDDSDIRYLPEPFDATDLASAPAGLKTMLNCFHHMRPQQARKILESAQKNRQPLLIYEMAENKVAPALWWLTFPLHLPLTAVYIAVLTAWIRPITFRQLFFTYVIPIVPLFAAWDGNASWLRVYTFEDLDELLEGMDSSEYRWEKGHAKSPRVGMGTYLLGLPCSTERGD